MPKIATPSVRKVKGYVSEFPSEFQVSASSELHCKLCGTIVKHDRRSNVLKHRDSSKHKTAKSLKVPQQVLISTFNEPQEDFTTKVTSAFLAADIPLYKLNNPSIKRLFEHMRHRPPSVFSCRARVSSLAEKEFERICDLLSGKQVFIVIDEAEVCGSKFINTLIGDVTKPTSVYLASCKVRNVHNELFFI